MGGHVAFLSFHTCPLVQPGQGWAGGMNVYVDELARAMARDGIEVDVFTRRHDREVPESITVEPGFSLHHLEAGPSRELDPGRALRYLGVFTDAVIDRIAFMDDLSLIHSHYWLSGWAGLRVKRHFGLPHVHSSHTLGRVNEAHRRGNETPERLMRIATEQEVIDESDVTVVSSRDERAELVSRYGADAERVSIVTPGVDHDQFVPVCASRRGSGSVGPMSRRCSSLGESTRSRARTSPSRPSPKSPPRALELAWCWWVRLPATTEPARWNSCNER